MHLDPYNRSILLLEYGRILYHTLCDQIDYSIYSRVHMFHLIDMCDISTLYHSYEKNAGIPSEVYLTPTLE